MQTEIVGNGRQLSNTNAAMVVGVFREIRKTGALTPSRVLEHARRPNSPLRQFFEWDDSKAAREHRIQQARELIASVKVRIKADPDDKPRDIRCYVRIEKPKLGTSYEETIPTLETKTGRAQILAQALAELARLQEKYDALKELSEVFEALDRARRKKAA